MQKEIIKILGYNAVLEVIKNRFYIYAKDPAIFGLYVISENKDKAIKAAEQKVLRIISNQNVKPLIYA